MSTALISSGIQFPDTTITTTNLIPSGTRLLFHNSTAPVGWTRDTTIDDSALRIVSATPGSGGSENFSSALGSPSVSGSVSINGSPGIGNLSTSVTGNIDIGSTTLSVSQIPSHNHTQGQADIRLDLSGGRTGGFAFANGGNVDSHSVDTSNVGGSGSHTHNASHNFSGSISGAPDAGDLSAVISTASASINVKYQDFIIAQKD